MPINNVNGMNKADLVKLALQKKGVSAQQTQKPAYLTMTGSIFAAPNAKKTITPQSTVAKQNINKSLSDLTLTKNSSSKKTDNKSSDVSGDISASDGKAAQKDAGVKQEKASDLTKTTQKDNKNVQKIDKNSQKLAKNINKNDKSFKKLMQKEQKAFTKTQKDMTKTIDDIDKNDIEIQSLNNELQSLTAGDNTGVGSTSAFSLKLGSAVQEDQQSGSNNGNADRINDLKTRIEGKTSLGTAYGAKITTLQKKSSKSYARMNKMSAQHVKTQKSTQKQIQSNQKETSGIIKFADRADQIAQLVTQVGQALDYAGKGMEVIGHALQSNPYTAAAGTVMVSVGTGMQKGGKIAVMVGNYGSAAANITKTAGYAAEGNLKGALMSAGSALQSGAAAVKSTKSLKSDLKAINAKADAATAKAEAKLEAKVEAQAAGQIDGMSKKQSTKAIQEEILNGQNPDGTKLTAEQAKAKVEGRLQTERALVDGQMTVATEAKGKGIKDVAKFDKKVNKQAAKNITAKAKSGISSYGQVATTTASSKKGDIFEKLSKYGIGFQSLASQLPDSTSTFSTNRARRSFPLSQKARQIIASHQRRTASIARMNVA